MSPQRSDRARQLFPLLLLTPLLSVALLAACSDQATAPVTPPPTAHDSGAVHWRRAALDSLFGGAAEPLAAALAAQDSALDARAAAWVDSIITTLVPSPAASALPSRLTPAPAARAAAAQAFQTTMREAQAVQHEAKPYTLHLERIYDLEVTDDAVVLHERNEEAVVNMALAYGEPMVGNGNSYRSVLDHTLRVASCPDASGVSAGEWMGTHDLYTTFASPSYAGTDNWKYRMGQSASANIRATVNADAEIESYQYDLVHSAQREVVGLPARRGGASVRKAAVAPGALLSPLPDRDITSTSGEYSYLAHLGGGVQSLHMYFAFGSLVGFSQARHVWRSGRCVEVQEPGGPVQPASPAARMTLRPFTVHRKDGSRPAARVEAHAEGGSISPSGELIPQPASFTYTASATGSGRVRFRAVSRRGIGHGEVRFDPLESGSMIEYLSNTRYTIESREETSDEVIAGTLAGTQQLRSRLTLVPTALVDDDDVAAFGVVAITDHDITATGSVTSRGYDDGRFAGNAGFEIVGAGTTLNPAGAGQANYDSHAPERYPSVIDTAGVLRLYRSNGKHVYELDFGLTQLVARYDATVTMTYTCRDPDVAPTSTSRTTYSNTTRRFLTEQSDPGDCWPAGTGASHTRDLPFGFGAVSVLRTAQNPATGSSAMITGVYDPRLGVIEGEETIVINQCAVVRGHDPLQLVSVLQFTPAWMNDIDLEQGSCRLEYTLRWRFFVPPA
jgi:hypothetical protein